MITENRSAPLMPLTFSQLVRQIIHRLYLPITRDGNKNRSEIDQRSRFFNWSRSRRMKSCTIVGWDRRTESTKERAKLWISSRWKFVHSILDADENQRVLNDLYGQIERDQSSHRVGENLIYTGALRDPHASICFRLDEASEISGFSTCNSTDRREDCISYPNERRFDRSRLPPLVENLQRDFCNASHSNANARPGFFFETTSIYTRSSIRVNRDLSARITHKIDSSFFLLLLRRNNTKRGVSVFCYPRIVARE